MNAWQPISAHRAEQPCYTRARYNDQRSARAGATPRREMEKRHEVCRWRSTGPSSTAPRRAHARASRTTHRATPPMPIIAIRCVACHQTSAGHPLLWSAVTCALRPHGSRRAGGLLGHSSRHRPSSPTPQQIADAAAAPASRRASTPSPTPRLAARAVCACYAAALP